jgi:hypothetical protein
MSAAADFWFIAFRNVGANIKPRVLLNKSILKVEMEKERVDE